MHWKQRMKRRGWCPMCVCVLPTSHSSRVAGLSTSVVLWKLFQCFVSPLLQCFSPASDIAEGLAVFLAEELRGCTVHAYETARQSHFVARSAERQEACDAAAVVMQSTASRLRLLCGGIPVLSPLSRVNFCLFLLIDCCLQPVLGVCACCTRLPGIRHTHRTVAR